MKSIILFLCVLFIGSSSLQAQYKFNKLNYNYEAYNYEYGDPVKPGIAGVASFFVPGLGQVLSGETSRGLTFFGGYLVSYVLLSDGSMRVADFIQENPYYEGSDIDGLDNLTLGLVGVLVLSIWATADAVRVAKVNNLAFREERKRLSFNLEPSIQKYSNTQTVATGLKLNINF
ncbi:MAG: hypothetical protein VW058_09320 [Flavobacteriaceae bacterium]|jgi:hypothetical protein